MPRRKPPSSAPSAGGPSAGKRSKLARENNITAPEEADIAEAFSLFAEPMLSEKNGVIPIADVRRAMIALGLTPTPSELTEIISVLDPEDEGFATYPSFVAVCALKLRQREEDRDGEAHEREVDEAFGLFTGPGTTGTTGTKERIGLGDLKRVAKLLQEDVGEDVLRDMILEANGGAGVGSGVRRDEFERVLGRAGVWR
ncbi:hypothetical protein OQA88_1908 [Cercophora sp. LCS_1]